MSNKKYMAEVREFNFLSFTDSELHDSSYQFKKIIDEGTESRENVVHEHNLAKAGQFSIIQEVKDHRGHTDYENELFEKKVQEELNKSIKSVKKTAYDDAYRLGLQNAKNEIEGQFLKQFEEQVNDLKNFTSFIKKNQHEILELNRKEILRMIQLVCHWVLQKELNTDFVENMLPVILSKIQETNKIVIKVDPLTYEKLQNANELLQSKYDGFKDLKVVSDDHITHPGVVVESESNIFDATQETLKNKINDLFNTLTESSNGSGTSEN